MGDSYKTFRQKIKKANPHEFNVPNLQVEMLLAERDNLLAALEACEVVMATASQHGVRELLPPGYRDSWVAAHAAAREAIRKAKGEEG